MFVSWRASTVFVLMISIVQIQFGGIIHNSGIYGPAFLGGVNNHGDRFRPLKHRVVRDPFQMALSFMAEKKGESHPITTYPIPAIPILQVFVSWSRKLGGFPTNATCKWLMTMVRKSPK